MGARSILSSRVPQAVIRRISFVLPEPKRNSIYDSILESSVMDAEYVGMLGLAGLIALFGLLQNSEAVIIGAMLISPLMNPILSAALALLLGDGSLGRKSAAILALSIAGIIGITWLIAWISPLKVPTPQILARTNPNLLDLFIAFLSGFAGTLALRGSTSSLTIIPGVAIAVAVVPPLAVVGYGLSTHQESVAGGAFLLFVTNLVSIIISAALVFRLMGFRPHQEPEKGRMNLAYRMALSGGILVVLSIPLLQTLRKAVSQIKLRTEIESAVNMAFRTPHSSISDMSFTGNAPPLTVHATLRTTQYFETKQIDAAEDSLRRRLGSNAKLEVDQILVTQGGINPEQAAHLGNVLSGGVVRPVVQEPPFNFEESAGKMLADLQRQLEEVLAGTAYRPFGQTSVQLTSTPPLDVRVQLETLEPLDAQTVGLLSSQLSTRLSMPAQLHGEVSLNGQAYQSSLEIPKSRHALTSRDRESLAQLAKLVGQRPDLRLHITYRPASGGTGEAVSPPLWASIQRVLSQNQLNPSQWALQSVTEGSVSSSTQNVPSPAGEKPDHAARSLVSDGVVRYEFHIRQLF